VRRQSRFRPALGGLFLPLLASPLVAQAPGEAIVVVGATVWDGTGSAPTRPTTVVVRDGRIACAGSARQCPIPPGATRLDGSGKFLLPGLIDTHVHLLLRQNGVTDTAIKADLHDLLARGVTAVRDMGNNPAPLLIAVDSAQPAPRVFAMQLVAGIAFFSPETERTEDGHLRSHAPAAMGMKQLGWWPIMFVPAGNAEQVVKEAREAGAIGLKLYQDLDTLQIARLVQAAHAARMPVWGHGWVQPASVGEQSRAGQDGVVHAAGLVGELLDARTRDTLRSSSSLLQITADSATPESATRPAVLATLDSLAAHGTYLEPTLQAELFSAIRARASHRRLTLPQRYALAGSGFGIEVTRQAVKRGVRLTAGTDHVAYGPADERAQLNDELALFVDSLGLSPGNALLAATRDAAIALGPVGKDLGTIASGKLADLVLFSADPLADIRNLEKVEWVMKGGAIYRPEEVRSEK
jgi:imidazolonepropionase-like amidohydrolase